MNENATRFIEKLKTGHDVLGVILFGSWAREIIKEVFEN
jgi:predicted nucleotidyltransferase